MDGDSALDRFTRAITAYGGRVERVADLAAAAQYATRLALQRSPTPKLVVEERAHRPEAWPDAISPFILAREPADRSLARSQIVDTDVGVGVLDHAVADSGQAVLYRSREWGRLLAFLSPIYVGLLAEDTVVGSLGELLARFDGERLRTVAPIMTFVSGCSVSADIENIITRGVHGPLELHVLVLPPERLPSPTG
jgi:L-lactate dehydrogenase complex protein LldG